MTVVLFHKLQSNGMRPLSAPHSGFAGLEVQGYQGYRSGDSLVLWDSATFTRFFDYAVFCAEDIEGHKVCKLGLLGCFV